MNHIAVIIPCYRCKKQIVNVLARIGPDVHSIYVVDDKCPEGTGKFVVENNMDDRVKVLFHEVNQGVGGAVITGYSAAVDAGATILVKIDGDGQMDPALIRQFISPIIDGEADYTKGNRFYDIESVRAMPKVRLFGNAGLSFLTKLSTGYWDIFDPTNGYTAMNAAVFHSLHSEKIAKRFFFESDVLFRLSLIRAVVQDVPMDSIYADEISNLRITRAIADFSTRNVTNFLKRIFYNYFLRNFSIASLELILGSVMLSFGTLFGVFKWYESYSMGLSTPSGSVMLAALPIIIGMQLLMSFLNFDIQSMPRRPVSKGSRFCLARSAKIRNSLKQGS